MSSGCARVFDHVLIIMFENQYRSYVMKNNYMRRLAAQGIEMANYFGCMHPSQTNYIASVAAELCNMTNDEPPPSLLTQRTIVDLIEASPEDLQWKAYMDSYNPGNTPWSPELVPKDQYPYVIKHDPFTSFENIVRDERRWQRIQTEADFWSDLLNGTFPNYAWFTPNMWNDGHYLDGTQKSPPERAPLLVDQLATWLEGFFAKLRFPGPDSHLPPNTLVVVTFDEADFEAKYDAGKKYTYDGPNQIYTVLLGDHLKPGKVEEGYNHYSLIKTIERNFQLGDLGKNDTHANGFRFLWGESFEWEIPQTTPLSAPSGLAAASFAGTLQAIESGDRGALTTRVYTGGTWLEARPLPFSGFEPVARAAGDRLVLVVKEENGSLAWSHYGLQTNWSDKQVLVPESVSRFALTGWDGGNLMLAYVDRNDRIYSRRYAKGRWEDPVDVGFTTDGAVALATLGATLLLVFQKPGGCGEMQVVSYNTADYNVVTYPEGSPYSGPYDNTVKDAWAKSAYPVAHFAHGPNATTPGENEPLLHPYLGNGPLAAATLDGVIHLVHPGRHNSQLLTATYSLSGIMTPALPISYQATEKTTTSNGYGTLAEAGWSKQATVVGAYADDLLVMATHEDVIYTFHGGGARGAVHLTTGRYRESERP